MFIHNLYFTFTFNLQLIIDKKMKFNFKNFYFNRIIRLPTMVLHVVVGLENKYERSYLKDDTKCLNIFKLILYLFFIKYFKHYLFPCLQFNYYLNNLLKKKEHCCYILKLFWVEYFNKPNIKLF